MKKKTLSLKKLVLNKESVMALSDSQVNHVIGGGGGCSCDCCPPPPTLAPGCQVPGTAATIAFCQNGDEQPPM